MKLKLTLIASATYFAMTLGAYAVSVSSETNGVPGGTISTPGSEAKGNPLPPPRRSSEIMRASMGGLVLGRWQADLVPLSLPLLLARCSAQCAVRPGLGLDLAEPALGSVPLSQASHSLPHRVPHLVASLSLHTFRAAMMR